LKIGIKISLNFCKFANIDKKMKIFATLPVTNEPDVERTIRDILAQKVKPEVFLICVNQPDYYWEEERFFDICSQNMKTLKQLETMQSETDVTIFVLDKCSRGNGWGKNKAGIGEARKFLMDMADSIAQKEDIIVSLDADTHYPDNYFARLLELYSQHKDIVANSNEYYHPFTRQNDLDLAMLRYEIYMRFYYLNSLRINSPYQFTALGSAMSVRVWAYRKIGGIAPKISGEDFYFLQQLAKIGKITNDSQVIVRPAARLSNRVVFGTGPALIRGIQGDFTSYPIYPAHSWDLIKAIYGFFEFVADKVYDKNGKMEVAVKNPLSNNKIRKYLTVYGKKVKKIVENDLNNLSEVVSENDKEIDLSYMQNHANIKSESVAMLIEDLMLFKKAALLGDEVPLLFMQENKELKPNYFEKFYKNAKDKMQFVKYCKEKFDGLKILQALRFLSAPVFVNKIEFSSDKSGELPSFEEISEQMMSSATNIANKMHDVIEEQDFFNILENAQKFGIKVSRNFSMQSIADMAVLRDSLFEVCVKN
jgi:hypothetical protein